MNIPNLIEIAVAWKRAAKPTPEQEELADERLATCDPCGFKAYSELIQTFKCSSCGCPLNKKVFTPKGAEGCPEGKWKR